MNIESTINKYIDKNFNRYLTILKRMVAINSFTENRQGVNKLAGYISKTHKKLGFDFFTVSTGNPMYGNHLILQKKGTSSMSIVCLLHLDTVFPPGEEKKNNFHWRQANDKIFGPGTNDMKGGILALYMMLDVLHKKFPGIYNAINWKLLFNSSEETNSDEFGALCEQQIPGDTTACLVFEAGKQEGNIFSLVTARKGRSVFSIQTTGNSVHAGVDHHNGASAVIQLADILVKVHQLTDYTKNLTVNIGRIRGGTQLNRVADFAEATGEIRAYDPETLENALAKLLSFNGYGSINSHSGNFSCVSKVEIKRSVPAWPENEATNILYDCWQQAANSIGMSVATEERGGLSDGNYTWNLAPTIDGLGPHGKNAHCSINDPARGKEQEYVSKSSFAPKVLLNTSAIIRLYEQHKK